MTAVIPLGRFEQVPLKEAWPAEDSNFTPWLAQPEALKLLGDALNLELEVEAVEHWVGPFRADILARVSDDVSDAAHRVVIENQFGRTNHGHLGQILTYLAGIEHAKTVVWIAETFQSDHRAAIDWLNANTSEDYSFFAIEIELWRIGGSPPAPRFNIIASPNDWTKSARKASSLVLEGGKTETQQTRLAYWTTFGEFLKQNGSSFRFRGPQAIGSYWFAIGRSGCVISANISTEKQRVGVSLLLDDPDKAGFHALHAEKEAIEREIGQPLLWQEGQGRKRTRIALYRFGVDATDQSQWPAYQAWMLGIMDRFRATFANRVKTIPLKVGAETGNDGDASDE